MCLSGRSSWDLRSWCSVLAILQRVVDSYADFRRHRECDRCAAVCQWRVGVTRRGHVGCRFTSATRTPTSVCWSYVNCWGATRKTSRWGHVTTSTPHPWSYMCLYPVIRYIMWQIIPLRLIYKHWHFDTWLTRFSPINHQFLYFPLDTKNTTNFFISMFLFIVRTKNY